MKNFARKLGYSALASGVALAAIWVCGGALWWAGLKCQAATPVPVTSYKIYTVTDPAKFLTLYLPLPAKSIVLWNSAVLLPGVQYDVDGDPAAGTQSFRLRWLPLQTGEHVTVIAIP
jgi:hypothetical protein